MLAQSLDLPPTGPPPPLCRAAVFQESGGQTKLGEVNLAPSLPAIIQMGMDSSKRTSPCSGSQCRGWWWDVGAGPCLIGVSLPTSQSSLGTGLLAPRDFGTSVTFLPSSPLMPTLQKCFHTCGTLTNHLYTLPFLFCGLDRNGKTHWPLNKHFLYKRSNVYKSHQKYTKLPRSHHLMPATITLWPVLFCLPLATSHGHSASQVPHHFICKY